MDEPPRKRRKTASPNATELTPSPLKKHPRRPSFASPTKASLARFNPSLLQTGREALIKRGKQARAFIFGGDAEESAGAERSQNEIGQTGVGTGPDNSLAKSTTNPSTKVRRNLRRSPSVEEEDDEPELPQTSPRALEQDTPRRGMLFSSPSKPPPRKPSGAHPAFNSKQPQNLERSRETENGVEGHEDQDKEGAEKKEPPDPELENRKREKEKLLREIAELQNDVEQCVDKVKWLHSQSPSQVTPPGEIDDLISLINRMNDSGMVEKEKTPAYNFQPTVLIPPIHSASYSTTSERTRFAGHPIAPPHRTGRPPPIPANVHLTAIHPSNLPCRPGGTGRLLTLLPSETHNRHRWTAKAARRHC